MRRSGLGRGLGALIPPEGATSAAFQELPLASIEPNPHQPRAAFDEGTLSELTASIRKSASCSRSSCGPCPRQVATS